MTTSKILSDLFRWPAFIGYVILLFVFMVLPGEKIPEMIVRVNDKLLHFVDFFLLALLGFKTFNSSSKRLFQAHAGTKIVTFSLFYGALLEWIQTAVPGRDASFRDWMADAAGTLAALMIFSFSALTNPP